MSKVVKLEPGRGEFCYSVAAFVIITVSPVSRYRLQNAVFHVLLHALTANGCNYWRLVHEKLNYRGKGLTFNHADAG